MTSQIALKPFGAQPCAFTSADLAAFEREMALPFDDREIVDPAAAPATIRERLVTRIDSLPFWPLVTVVVSATSGFCCFQFGYFAGKAGLF
ncbi:hypothetical protein [Antarcticirhabdus aurantiaca]|uniref:Uncharacterized protein n=1 Tax=Antarcticirhabdus aurantiaca TaxID=2606717 RepID=A0ACD4NK16_9HYPH|nr:hypothetical protein [Antarcticirhabdus aurantiaca]WAJ27148.1 hypothetical protein OXU80_20160 [Jeongeuplla avenae]